MINENLPMKIRLIESKASKQAIREMLEMHGIYVKVAVDLQKKILAGGGEMHADCRDLLIENGSDIKDIWGASWIPDGQEIHFTSQINIRPSANNPNMEIADPQIRAQVKAIVTELLIE